MDKSLRFLMRRRALPVIASAAALAAAAGCGAASSSANESVASIPSSSPPVHAAGTATASAAAGSGGETGVVERLDDTPQQINAIIAAWNNCLVAHGATYGNVPGVAGSQNLANIPASAKAACMDKEPQLPPQLNPASNPQYRADSIANVACLRARGLMVHLAADSSVNPNGLSWAFDSNAPSPPANLDQIQQECQLKAFGGNK